VLGSGVWGEGCAPLSKIFYKFYAKIMHFVLCFHLFSDTVNRKEALNPPLNSLDLIHNIY